MAEHYNIPEEQPGAGPAQSPIRDVTAEELEQMTSEERIALLDAGLRELRTRRPEWQKAWDDLGKLLSRAVYR